MAKNTVRVMTVVGRLINSALWEKDAFTDDKGREADPRYKVEVAFDSGEDIAELEAAIRGVIVAEWGEGAEAMYDNGEIRDPILSGDDLADRIDDGQLGEALLRVIEQPGVVQCQGQAFGQVFQDGRLVFRPSTLWVGVLQGDSPNHLTAQNNGMRNSAGVGRGPPSGEPGGELDVGLGSFDQDFSTLF